MRLAHQLVVDALKRRGAARGDAGHRARELVELIGDLFDGEIALDLGQHARHGDVEDRADDAAGHDDR